MEARSHRALPLLGIFLTGFSMLAFEVTLTRIFSVTVWYHFAFLVISIAMLGISVSGVVVYFLSRRFPREKTMRLLSCSSLAFSLTVLLAYLVVRNVRFSFGLSLESLVSVVVIHFSLALPFLCGGITIGLALTQMVHDVGRLYFSDLVGASFGCLLMIPLYGLFSAPEVIVLIAVTLSLAALCFGAELRDGRLVALAFAGMGLMTLVLVVNVKWDILGIKYSKAGRVEEVLFEKWNSFSRVSAGYFDLGERPFGWGLSPLHRWERPEEIMVGVDASAGTPITRFDGDYSKVEYLKYDITSLGHYLVDDGEVLVIGPGGGRDVLAALAFGQERVTGVEVNPIMVELVNDVFGDFSGHLYERPGVEIVIDEGRSYISRSRKKFDLIQASMVDTWAASSAGAYTLMENNLYTIQAFQEYLDHLTPEGVFSISRWYVTIQPGETLRVVSLAVEALERMGSTSPQEHIFVAKCLGWLKGGGVATVLVKKSPFTEAETRTLASVCRNLGFELVLTPESVYDNAFDPLFDGSDREKFFRRYPIDISPPTDDRPFFFHMVRLKDFYRSDLIQGSVHFGETAIQILVKCMLAVFVLTLAFIFAPLVVLRRAAVKEMKYKFGLMLYFACLGLGFMLIEIPTIQRLTLFLGHPVYSLSVALFSLLFFSGIGSLYTDRLVEQQARQRLLKALVALSLLLVVYVFALPPIFYKLIGLPNHVRIGISVALLFPLGLLMGIPFPLGLKMVNGHSNDLIPWCWAINGATSVFASVLAIAISISCGFSLTLLAGLFAYLLAMGLIGMQKARS